MNPMSSFFFIFSVPAFTLSGNGTNTVTVNIASTEFWIYYINGHATDGDSVDVKPTISTEGEQLSNGTVLFNSIVGTAQRPFILPEPLILPVRATLLLEFTNRLGSSNIVDIALVGLKKRPL